MLDHRWGSITEAFPNGDGTAAYDVTGKVIETKDEIAHIFRKTDKVDGCAINDYYDRDKRGLIDIN